jgi:hypothetical protein
VHPRRQEPAQAQSLALGLGEGGAFVAYGIVEDLDAARLFGGEGGRCGAVHGVSWEGVHLPQ